MTHNAEIDAPLEPGACSCPLRNVEHTQRCLAARIERLERLVAKLTLAPDSARDEGAA